MGAAIALGFGTISFLLIRTRNLRMAPERPTLHNLLAGLRYVLEKIVLGAISLDLFVVCWVALPLYFRFMRKISLMLAPGADSSGVLLRLVLFLRA